MDIEFNHLRNLVRRLSVHRAEFTESRGVHQKPNTWAFFCEQVCYSFDSVLFCKVDGKHPHRRFAEGSRLF